MSHFADARRQVLNFVRTNIPFRARTTHICLIWYLQGRLRVLLRPAAGQTLDVLRLDALNAIAPLSQPFWAGDVWIHGEDSSRSEIAVYEKVWQEAGPVPIDVGPPEIYLLERHVSKDAWFVPTLEPPWPLSEHTPPILSFFSFKGGVGRTTSLLALAVQLARGNHRVVLIDLDLESPGLLGALPPSNGVAPVAGVVDYLLERPLVVGWNELPFDDFFYTVDAPAIVGNGLPITVIPAGPVDEMYLQKVARLNYAKIYTLSAGQPEQSPLFDLLRRARQHFHADYVLLDSRAGFHDLGGLALSGMTHLDVLFGLDSESSWQGLNIVVRFLGQDRIERDMDRLDCAVVHALAPSPGPERDAAFRRFKERSHDTFSEHYYEEPVPDLEADQEPHYPIVLGFNPDVQRYQTIADVADRLTQGDFRTFAERLLERVGRDLQ